MRIFGRILAVLGILALFGLITGAAYTAGLAASGAAVQPMAYGLGFGFFGFGLFHFFGFILFFFLLFALLRIAFGGGRRGWGGPGHMGGGWSQATGNPREAWIRDRLEDWHKTAHAAQGGAPASTPPPAGPVSGPDANPPA
jgi:hypothetical protein